MVTDGTRDTDIEQETAAKRAAVLGQLLSSREQRIAELEAENEQLRRVLREAEAEQ